MAGPTTAFRVLLRAYVLFHSVHAILPDSMTVTTTQAGSAPDRTFDYMAFLEQEISDDKAAYAAGNNAYYYTGQGDKDTLGLESPFFDDLRSRGTGLVAHDPAAAPSPDDCCSNVGYGNDYFEWDYHKYARVLVGSAYVRGVKHEFPTYDRAYWRPDQMVMRYNLGGVRVVERKFVADNDVVSVILTADEDITIDFDGRSFYSNQAIAKNATCSLVGEKMIRVTRARPPSRRPSTWEGSTRTSTAARSRCSSRASAGWATPCTTRRSPGPRRSPSNGRSWSGACRSRRRSRRRRRGSRSARSAPATPTGARRRRSPSSRTRSRPSRCAPGPRRRPS